MQRRVAILLLAVAATLSTAATPIGGISVPELPAPDVPELDPPNPFPLGACVRQSTIRREPICVYVDPDPQ